jgi:TatD DNase family protein
VFDTHCHLNLPDAFPEPEPYFDAAYRAGVSRLVLVGIDPASSERAVRLAEGREGVWAVVGRHPNYAQDYDPRELDDLRALLRHPKVVAIGELGLDYHWDFATPDQQVHCLLDQLDLADEEGVPIVFHCRKAYSDLLDILEKRGPGDYLFHCFSGNEQDAQRALALGGLFGVDGPLTYKSATDLRAIVASLPRERIVLETDSPYMTPVPHRGKPNQPAYLDFINRALAALWRVSPEESEAQTDANAARFFRLPA